MSSLSGTPIRTPHSPDQTWQRLISNAVPQDELPSLIETVFSEENIADLVDSLQGEHVQTFIDVIDAALDSLDLAPRIRRVCITSLHRTCARHTLVPRSLKIELSGDPPGVLMHHSKSVDVWKYQHGGRKVAVKVLRLHATNDLEMVARRFCKEFMQWKALRHPNVLPLLGVRMTENEFAMVSEWMPNGNINGFVAVHQDANRFELLAGVARGLDYMHSMGVVHGALKGARIFIDRSCHACLADFELLATVSDLTTLDSPALGRGGAARWMSPELVDAEFHGYRWSKSSDRYALGMVIYEVLSGHVPFYQHSDRSVPGKVVKGDRPERPQGAEGAWVTDPIWKILKRCWVAEPKNRPTIQDILQCLEEPSRARPEEDEKSAEAEKPRLTKETEEWRIQVEGEIIESPASEESPKEVWDIFSRKEVLKIDASITKTHSSPLDLSNPTKNVVPVPLPALARARIIEDLGHISYPEGVTGPKPELNVNAKRGKFRYDREFLLQFMAICTEKPDAPSLVVLGLDAIDDQPHYPMTRGGSGRHRTSPVAIPPPLSRQALMSGLKPNAPGESIPITKTRPAPLDLSKPTKVLVAAPLPALAKARIIEYLDHISYPEGVNGPKPELNIDSKKGKFRYDREFLLQFQPICTEKPDVPLDPIGLEAVDDQSPYPLARGGSGPHRTSSAAVTPPKPQQASMPGFKPNAPGGFTMGNFSTPTSKMTSEERFAISQRSASSLVTGSGMPFGRPGQTIDNGSKGGPSGKRTRTKRNKARAVNVSSDQAAGDQTANPEPVAPLEVSANRWTRKTQANDEQNVERKVRALLNKLTMEKFDLISDQIIDWVNKSEAEKDGRTLIRVIRLVFEGATGRAAWSEMYARLCRKMMESISPNVQDDGIRDSAGKPIPGGQLFRKYLLNRCQEDFERGWAAEGTAVPAAAAKASGDATVKKVAETSNVFNLYSDEYCAAQKAKRQSLCLVQFIGELYKVQMLTERVMHEHLKKFLGNFGCPEEEAIESLCRLLMTVGKLLDNPKARAHMDIYFTRMKELGKCSDVAPRMRFMLQDLIELRERKWVPRNQVAAPTTIAQVREEAAKQRARAAKEAGNRILTTSRGGGPLGEQQADGWSVAGGSTPRPPPKAGDLSNFGKINKSRPLTVGPSSVWAGKRDVAKHDSTRTRVDSSSEMFKMLGVGGAPEPLPKFKPLPGPKPFKEKIAEDIDQFFSIRNIDDSEEYFNTTPSKYHHLLVDKMVSKAIASNEADGKLVADAFARAAEKRLCSIPAFEEGFLPIAEFLDDIAIDAPKAFQIMATMMKGAGLDKDEERRTGIAQKSTDGDRLLRLLA